MSETKRSLIRLLFKVMRNVAPKVTVGSRVFLFRNADIREVLARHKDFLVGPLNGENMERHIGPFFLGMDDGPQLQLERGIMRQIISRDDAERIRVFVRKKATEHAEACIKKGHFDLVEDFTRIVPLRLVEDYFGVSGPDDKTFLHWNRSLFADIFMNLNSKEEVRAIATKSGIEMKAYLAKLIQDRRDVMDSGGRVPNDLLSRLLSLQGTGQPAMDNDSIRRNLSGTFMGGIEPISQACVQILGQIYQRKDILAQAREAALKDDVKTIAKIAFEAWRFHPNLPLILRYAEEKQILGQNGGKNRKIKAGKTIFAMTSSAMFDGRGMERPGHFDVNRDFSDSLQYGHGFHSCYGTYINLITIPEMITAFLKAGNTGPISGKGGKVVKEGAFPAHQAFELEK